MAGKPRTKADKLLTIKQRVARQNDFINALIRNNYHLTNTCKEIKLSRTTYYEWMQTKDFAKRMDKMRDMEVDVIEDAFRDLVKERNAQVVMFGLKTRGAKRGYQEKQQIEHFGDGGIAIQINAASDQVKPIRKIEEEKKELE